jgi:methenyltetrahydromethanopterin cyclohydrolase
MFSVNEQAMKIVKQIIVEQELLNVGVNELNNGSTVIDLGVNYPGGWAAAKHLVEITLGGLGTAELSYKEIEGLILPQVSIHVDHPVVACISCQLSGWALEEAKNDAGIVPLISGPVRTVAKKDDFAQVHSYHDRHDTVVAVLQDMQVPNEKLTSYLAQECNVKTENVYVLVAPTGSLAGFINVASSPCFKTYICYPFA